MGVRGLRLVILAVAIAAGVGAVALVQNELERARLAAGTTVQVAPPAPPPIETPRSDVLVAARNLRMGEVLQPGDMRWQAWPQETISEFFITRDDNPSALEEVEGVIVRRGFVAGEPAAEAKFLRLDQPGVMSALLREGMRAIAVTIGPETAAGGFILPGDYVDIILTREIEVSQGAARETKMEVAHTLMRAVRVLAIDQIFEEGGGDAAEIGRTATLEVTPEQAENLALAEQSGTLTLTLRGVGELAAKDGEDPIEPTPQTAFDLRDVSDDGEFDVYGDKTFHEIIVIRGAHKQRTVVE